MLGIDCLLKNTDVVDAVKTAMEYVGVTRAHAGKEASLRSVYKELTDKGVEIDLGSAAKIYSDVLSTKNHPLFSSAEEVNQIAGKYFDDMSRNLLLRDPKEGEQKISKLSPREAVSKRLAGAFSSKLIKDERTKSILKTMQDAYMQYAKKMAGPLPDDVSGKEDKRTLEEVVRQALNNKDLGYTDNVTGAINSFNDLHNGAKALMKDLGELVKNSDDPILKQQWDIYTKSFHDAVLSLIFSTDEGKQVLHDSLKSAEGGGFVKTLKDGTEVLDHKKLGQGIKSIIQYRDNVINALKGNGFTEEQATQAADSLQKEYYDLRGKTLENFKKSQEDKQAAYEQSIEKPTISVGDTVKAALKENENYTSLKNEAAKEGQDMSDHKPELTFSPKQAATIMYESIKNSPVWGKEGAEGQSNAVDWKKLVLNKPDRTALEEMIINNLTKNEGIKKSDAQKVADSLMKSEIHDQLMTDIDNHAKANLDTKEAALDKTIAPNRQGDMTRLAELHAMGIFNGAHDDLLHHVLGVDSLTQETRKQLMDIMDRKQQLIQQFGSKEFLYHSMDSRMQHEVNALIDKNIADKNALGKVAKALYDYQNFVNMGIIANPYNIAENTVSGFQANMGQTLTVFKQMGVKEGLKVFSEMQRAWASTLKDVAKGGISYGIEGGKFTQGSAIADKYTFNNWGKLNSAGKVATVVLSYAHLGLNAMDSAYKVAIHQKTTMLNLHKALTEVPDEHGRKMTRDQANEYLNEHLFGKSLDDARKLAEYTHDKLGLKYDKNNIERSARELVYSNIFSDGQINEDIIDAAVKGAYNVASVGLGHEARPGVLGLPAKWMKDLQVVTQKGYDNLIDKGNYNQAALYHILVQTMGVNGAFKFAHGVINWMVLRPITSGVGLVTGKIAKTFQKSEYIDYTNKKDLTESFQRQAQANADINRAIVGLSMFAAQAGATALYGSLKKQDDDESNLDSGFEAIKENPVLNKVMNKFGSDILSLMYVSYTAKTSNGQMEQSYASWQGALKYVENLTNVGQGYSIPERMEEVGKLLHRGGSENKSKAAGIAGEMVRGIMPGSLEVPFLRSFTGGYYIGKSIAEDEAQLPPFYSPQSFHQGMMDNQVFQDVDAVIGTDIMGEQELKTKQHYHHRR